MAARSEQDGQSTASATELMTEIRLKRPENRHPAQDSARLHQAYQILARSLLRQALAASQQSTDDIDAHAGDMPQNSTNSHE